MLTDKERAGQPSASEAARPTPSPSTTGPLTLDGSPLSIADVARFASASSSQAVLAEGVAQRMELSVEAVREAVAENKTVYGVTTGFGGMAGVTVRPDQAAASQNNLLSFLAAGAGDEIDGRHTRAAMLLRANVLAQGCSGVRPELVQRLLTFLSADVTPVVRELGSIGASGDLVPLSVIARAVTGINGFVNVRIGDQTMPGNEALSRLQLEPLKLQPKEGLALVNGTSFSAAIAANAVAQSHPYLSMTMAVQAMMLEALQVQHDPFDEFVHQKKPHPGQVWSAKTIKTLLTEGNAHTNSKPTDVQDRYSLRCFPQYMGSIVEGIARITDVVETEMNAVSDNPLIDVSGGRFCQSGNFLGQYIGIAMDDLRRMIGLMAKHLDVQIATLVAPEFNNGLPASLRGNDDVPFHMGLKGLQICGNSIMPLLTWSGNPMVEHYPTHAEQFNQNINGLSWGSAHQAWKSIGLFGHYLSVATMFAVQSLDLRAHALLGHYDGRALLGTNLKSVYEAACEAMNVPLTQDRPMLFNDSDIWIEQQLAQLNSSLEVDSPLLQSVAPITSSFHEEFS